MEMKEIGYFEMLLIEKSRNAIPLQATDQL